MDRRKSAGIPPEQAEAVVHIIAEAQGESVTREHLDSSPARELIPIRTELAVLKWMSGIVIGGVVALIIKTFLA